MTSLDDRWHAWLLDNLARGCSHESIVIAMLDAGFEPAFAQQSVATYARFAGVPAYQYDACPVAAGNRIYAHDREVEVIARCAKPQVVVFDKVLTDEECATLIARCRARMNRSTIIDPNSGAEQVIAERTSSGAAFARCEDELIERIERRLAALMAWPLENGEGMQVLRYGVGAQYTPHFDYFPPQDPGSAAHLATGGQRVATMVLYLNDVEAGGATVFPDAGIEVAPRRGRAVYFRYANAAGQLDPLSLHAGAPVTAGEKWIMTKWVRERRY
ncbi:2OG-Fe(II) oxygenase [Niveibacterium umoris]|uniref:Prolyl 4-hydroxylase n=1 Tax=Niveibacterium umoris TaxID=1193620 RepID=A0A840BB99_9RHOO|nr:2OG-Fe(II) oxygenase [Niveibacterium umoris]MBB4010811.1 prolyl 4-hydroxylase [Niveibacterium umoris]